MKINWKLRIQNKATLTSLIATICTFIYQICGIFGVIPAISESDAINMFGIVINLLVAIGIVTDPTTQGVTDNSWAILKDKTANNIIGEALDYVEGTTEKVETEGSDA